MDRGITSPELVGDLDQTGLAPITAGPLDGPQEPVIDEPLALQVPGQPQVSSENYYCIIPVISPLGYRPTYFVQKFYSDYKPLPSAYRPIIMKTSPPLIKGRVFLYKPRTPSCCLIKSHSKDIQNK